MLEKMISETVLGIADVALGNGTTHSRNGYRGMCVR